MRTSHKRELLKSSPIETFDDAEPATPEQIRLFSKATTYLCEDRLFGFQWPTFNKWGMPLQRRPEFTNKYIQPQNLDAEFTDGWVGIYHILSKTMPFRKAPNSVIEMDIAYHERWESGSEGNTGYFGHVNYILIDDGQSGPQIKRLIKEKIYAPGIDDPDEVRITIDPNDSEFSKRRKQAILREDWQRMVDEAQERQKTAQLEDVCRVEMQAVLELLWQVYHPKFVPLPPLSELIDTTPVPVQLRAV